MTHLLDFYKCGALATVHIGAPGSTYTEHLCQRCYQVRARSIADARQTADPWWGKVKSRSEEHRALPETLRRMSGVPRQQFQSERLPKNATPPVDRTTNGGQDSQCMTNDANDRGNLSDCPEQTTQECSRVCHAGEASPQNRTQDLTVSLAADDVTLLTEIVGGIRDELPGAEHRVFCSDDWERAAVHRIHAALIEARDTSPHRAGSDRTSQGGELFSACSCDRPIVYSGMGQCMACGGELRQS